MKYENVYLCYSPQNYVKALYLAYFTHLRGERSKVLALAWSGDGGRAFFDAEPVFWADVEDLVHEHRYVRLLARDRLRPHVFVGKLALKAYFRARRVMNRAARQSLMSALGPALGVLDHQVIFKPLVTLNVSGGQYVGAELR